MRVRVCSSAHTRMKPTGAAKHLPEPSIQNEPKLGSLTLFFKIKDAGSLELFTATRVSWEALQGTAQRFTELRQPPPRDKAVIHEGGTIKILTMRPNERESVFLNTELAIVHYCLQASTDRNTQSSSASHSHSGRLQLRPETQP